MLSQGKIEEFLPDLTNIDRYLERLEQYFVAIQQNLTNIEQY